jgi:hypothetical protein
MRHCGAVVVDTSDSAIWAHEPMVSGTATTFQVIQMSLPMIVAGVVLWTLNILTAWSMIAAGYPLVVVFTAAVAVLFTLLVTRRRSAARGNKLAATHESMRTEPLNTSV